MNEKASIEVKSASYGATARLKKAMNRLAELAPNESPVLSCFVDLTESRHHSVEKLELQVKELVRSCNGDEKKAVLESFHMIKLHLLDDVSDQASGCAIYARSGSLIFFEALEFGVTLQTCLLICALPQIYPLVETSDTYERFVATSPSRSAKNPSGSPSETASLLKRELESSLDRSFPEFSERLSSTSLGRKAQHRHLLAEFNHSPCGNVVQREFLFSGDVLFRTASRRKRRS